MRALFFLEVEKTPDFSCARSIPLARWRVIALEKIELKKKSVFVECEVFNETRWEEWTEN